MKNIFRFTFIAATALFISCEDQYTICNLSKEVKFIAGFYQRVSGADAATPAPSLSVYFLNGTNPIYNQQPYVSSMAIPLNTLLDSAQYVITIANNLQKDTLTVVYTSQSTNLSPECGSIVYNNITKLYSTANTIDSVKLINPVINNNPLQNAKIYF